MNSGDQGIFSSKMVLAVILAVVILIFWDYFFLQDIRVAQSQALQDTNSATETKALDPSTAPSSLEDFILQDSVPNIASSVDIKTDTIYGSLSLEAGRIDDITLINYYEEVERDAQVQLFQPKGSALAYFFQSGWLSSETNIVPDNYTIWQFQGGTLTPQTPVTLTWNNGQGLFFTKIISIDSQYMITVKDIVYNNSNRQVSLSPYAFILRHNDPDVEDLFISHEGLVGYLNKTLERIKYSDVVKKTYNFSTQQGYMGFTDKYWLSAIVLDDTKQSNVRFLSYRDSQNINNYQVDYSTTLIKLDPNSQTENITRLFVGPKVYQIIADYSQQYNIPKFEDTIDFGWFFFFTKPMITFLLWIYSLVHDFGMAILIFTVVIRIVLLPIAYKSYISLAKMKELQPKMKELKDLYSGDMQKYNQEVMALYKKEKVNPLSGCLPVLLQIPIFFSIYKVIFISIELRHAPFWGWILDMAAADPTNIFNLFGLLPFDPPGFLHVGVWPILMALSLYLQQRMTSGGQAMNEIQKNVMNIMPWVFMIVASHFPAGLVIYWTWSNVISIVQQYFINRKVHSDLLKKKLGKSS